MICFYSLDYSNLFTYITTTTTTTVVLDTTLPQTPADCDLYRAFCYRPFVPVQRPI